MTPTHPDWKLTRELPLPQIRAHALEFEHLETGLRLFHLQADDPENSFAFAFATPPNASDGVPHILEHAVLAGSEKFPVKEPFFELVKSSPAGFINAMTSDVFTIYPICTTLEKDFFNLADVYCDAVFRPLLTQETFEREGHHLELQTAGDLDSDLIRSGIVYNEMKGAYSNTEMVIGWRLKNRLFPGGALGFDSGGAPEKIPDLTWEGLREFHDRFYAPGNCTLFLYGDISTQKHLDYFGRQLKGLGRQPSLAARPVFEKFAAPRRSEETFAVEPNSDKRTQTFLSLRWRCGDGLDRFDEIAWNVLSRLLAGHDGAPLQKALVDSKLGADVMACGVEDVESELTFHVALKGSEPECADAFEKLVLQTLENIADTRFSREEIETALRQVAYATLEVPSLFPLHLAFDLARYAACGADPLEATKSKEKLDKLREIALEQPQFFGDLIRTNLLQNSHRLLVIFRPDDTQAAREEAREKSELAAIRQTLSRAQLHAIDARAQALLAAQNEPNSPDALATLPRLRKADLPAAPREMETQLGQMSGFATLRNDVFSNGVVYLNAAADLSGLPSHLWKFVPRYAEAFGKMGANGHSWEQVSARRAALTGGLRATPFATLHAQTGAPVVDLRFSLKTLDSDIEGALELLRELVFSLDARDAARLSDVQIQSVASMRDGLINNAISSAMLCAAQEQSAIGWMKNLWDGPIAFEWNTKISSDFAASFEELASGIEAVRDFLLQSARWSFSFTGSDSSFGVLERELSGWQRDMRAGQPPMMLPHRGTSRWDGGELLPLNLGLAASLEVQFCARSFSAPTAETAPLVDLGFDLLRFDYFLPEIRLKGNAYGGGSSLMMEAGVATFYSYRDPRLSETLDVFDAALPWVKSQNWSDDDLERALLGNVSDAVPAIRPADSTGKALTRFRRGQSAPMRAALYSQKLAATGAQVKDALVNYLSATGSGAVAVASSRANLEAANKTRREKGKEPLEIREMLANNAIE